jgi:3'-5' exoribonuclease
MNGGADPAYSPREWIGDDEFPWPPTLGLLDGDAVAACFSVSHVSSGRTRSDTPFLRLQLTDCYGTLDARMWDDVEAVADHVRVGSYIGVRGRIETYQDQRQLQIEALALLHVELDDLVLFLPRSARSPERMDAELTAVMASVNDDPLRALLELLLAAGTETGHAFRLAPAAKQNHHAYLGGLLEHTLSVARVCEMLAMHYGAALDRDLLITGALLHDVGKIREIGARSGFPYTDEGKLLGHIVIGMQIVADAAREVPDLAPARLLLLQHLIASHQGRFEWQSPREPRTLEALLLHYVDDLDAKLTQAGALTDAVTAGWTAYDRSLGRDFLRHRTEAPPPPAAPGRHPTGADKYSNSAASVTGAGGTAARSGVTDAGTAAAGPTEAAGTAETDEGGSAAATGGLENTQTDRAADTESWVGVPSSHGGGGAASTNDAADEATGSQRSRSGSDPLETLDLFDSGK